MANRTENAVIEATLYWPNLTEKNDLSGKYQVDLGQLSADAVKTLKSWGLSIRNDMGDGEKKPNKGDFVVAKSQYPIDVVFKAGIAEVDASVIANETKARVKINPFDWNFKGKLGTSLGIMKMQVTHLEEYVKSDTDADDFGDAEDEAPFDLDADDEFAED